MAIQGDLDVTIRMAREEDEAALNRHIELSVRELQKNDYTPRQIEGALGSALGLDTQLIRDATYFVAVLRKEPAQIVASGGWSFRKTLCGSDHVCIREDALLDPASDAAKIRAIFVHPAWARKGLGSMMLSHCEEAARRAGFGKVEMGATLTGVPLYLLKGYQPEELMHIPLPNGEALPVQRMTKIFA